MYRFGCAKRLITDQGREFINGINTHLQALLGTEHRMTSAYHPQSNGMVEKLNHTIQSCLLKVVSDHQRDWDTYIDPILFAIRTSKHKSTGYTPFEMMYQRFAIGWILCYGFLSFLFFVGGLFCLCRWTWNAKWKGKLMTLKNVILKESVLQ